MQAGTNGGAVVAITLHRRVSMSYQRVADWFGSSHRDCPSGVTMRFDADDDDDWCWRVRR